MCNNNHDDFSLTEIFFWSLSFMSSTKRSETSVQSALYDHQCCFSLTSFCDYVLKSAHIPAHTCTPETNQSCLLHWNMYGGNIREVESCCTFFRLLMWFLWGSVVLWYFCTFQVKVLLSDERLRDSSGYQGSRVEAMFYLNSAFESLCCWEKPSLGQIVSLDWWSLESVKLCSVCEC